MEQDEEPTLVPRYSNIPAQCIGQCAQCELDGMEKEQFMYINGDFHIAGWYIVSDWSTYLSVS